MHDPGDVFNRPLAVGKAPHERGGLVQLMCGLGLLVEDHQFLPNGLCQDIVFSGFWSHAVFLKTPAGPVVTE